MKKLSFLLVSILMVGCVGSPDPVLESSNAESGPDRGSTLPLQSEGDSPGACGERTFQRIEFMGRTYIVEDPVLCNPYVKDRGDPTPEELGAAEVSNPDPERVEVQVEEIAVD